MCTIAIAFAITTSTTPDAIQSNLRLPNRGQSLVYTFHSAGVSSHFQTLLHTWSWPFLQSSAPSRRPNRSQPVVHFPISMPVATSRKRPWGLPHGACPGEDDKCPLHSTGKRFTECMKYLSLVTLDNGSICVNRQARNYPRPTTPWIIMLLTLQTHFLLHSMWIPPVAT